MDLYIAYLLAIGSGHGEDLLFLFGPSILNNIDRIRFSPAEERLSSIMKRFWIEFIRKGSISSSPFGYGISWRKYSSKEDNYIIFRADNSLPATQSVVRGPIPTLAKDATAKQTAWLWNQLLPSLRDLKTNQKEDLGTTEMHLTSDIPYKNATYTLIVFVILLLILLVICVILLKKQAAERERDMF